MPHLISSKVEIWIGFSYDFTRWYSFIFQLKTHSFTRTQGLLFNCALQGQPIDCFCGIYVFITPHLKCNCRWSFPKQGWFGALGFTLTLHQAHHLTIAGFCFVSCKKKPFNLISTTINIQAPLCFDHLIAEKAAFLSTHKPVFLCFPPTRCFLYNTILILCTLLDPQTSLP